MIYLWLIVWRDIKSKPGRFLLLTLSLVLMIVMILSFVLIGITYSRIEKNWQNHLSGAWLIGRVADQYGHHLARSSRIPPATASQLMALEGVAQSSSYSGLIFDTTPPEVPDFYPTILGLSANGLTQLAEIPLTELLAASPDQIWIAADVMSLLRAEPGSTVELWSRRWRVAALPALNGYSGAIVMQLPISQAILSDPGAINFIVLHGNLDPAAVRSTAMGLDLFSPGSRYPLLVGISRVNWLYFSLLFQIGAIMWSLSWLAGAVISWEQAERTGLMRSLGGSRGKRTLPLLGVMGLIFTIATLLGLLLFLFGGGGTDQTFTYTLAMFALQWPIPIGLILLIALVAMVPHLLFLWRQPCGPKQPPPRGPGSPIILMLGFISFYQMAIIADLSHLSEAHALETEMRQGMLFASPAVGTVTSNAASGTASIEANVAERILLLPEIDKDRSFRLLRIWDRVGSLNNRTMNGIGIDTSSPKNMLDYAQIERGDLRFKSPNAQAVILGQDTAKWLAAELGDTVQLYGRHWQVVGILAAHSYWDDVAAFPLESLSEALGRSGSSTELWLAPRPSLSTAQLAAAISLWLDMVSEAQLALRTESDWADDIGLWVKAWFSSSIWQMGAILASIFLLILTLYHVRSDYHLKEAAVLRVVGASKWQATQPLIKEGLQVSLWSSAVGALLFHGWAWVTEMPYLWDWNATAIGNLSVLIAVILGIAPPTIAAMRRSPLYLLRREH